jgi:predicted membrane protein
MEDKNKAQKIDLSKDLEGSHKRGKVLAGLLIVAIGVLFLMKELGVEMPFWLFSWKTLLIAVGFFTILKNKFRSAWGLLLMAVGGTFLAADFYPEVNITSLLLPVLIIIVGLFIIFKPRRKNFQHHNWKKWNRHDQHYKKWSKYNSHYPEAENSDDDIINSYVYMGALKKNILSKSLKGGSLKNRFGGIELNLSQADFEGEIILEIDQMFGGIELIVPAHWEVKSDLATGFSSVEDNRTMKPNINGDAPKTLILRGSNHFGGIEIKNY